MAKMKLTETMAEMLSKSADEETGDSLQVNTTSSTIKDLLHKQVGHEFANAMLYRNMAFWCENNGYVQTGKFFAKHAFEEERHGMDFANYMLGKGVELEHVSPEDVVTDYEDLGELLDAALKREYETTALIQKLFKVAVEKADTAEVIAHKYLMEQTEEEQLFLSLVNLYKLAQGNKFDFETAVMDLKNKHSKYKLGTLKSEG
jgi:ferritin